MNLDDKLYFVLLRHGETIYNIEKRLQSPNDRLSDLGKEQIAVLKKELLNFKFDKIISSDETRAIESAKIISEFIRLNFTINSLLREKSSGDFSDKLVDEVNWSNIKGSFLDKKISGGESVKEVMARASKFLKFMSQCNQRESILIISHGTFLRILFCLIFNKDIEDYLLNYNFPNATYMIISRSSDGRWNLEKSPLIKKDIEKNG